MQRTATRVRPRLVERRRQQDRLIDTVMDALAARDAALAALAAVQATLDEATAALAGFGIAGHEIATLLGVPAHELSPVTTGRRTRGPGAVTAVEEAHIAYAGGDDVPVRIWLAMIERGPAPKTHGLDRDGGLLCGGRGDPEHLATWTGYPFDVDCQRCVKFLVQQLTEDEFG
jgi:hypothetical protein